jgi:hypothetical protein
MLRCAESVLADDLSELAADENRSRVKAGLGVPNACGYCSPSALRRKKRGGTETAGKYYNNGAGL